MPERTEEWDVTRTRTQVFSLVLARSGTRPGGDINSGACGGGRMDFRDGQGLVRPVEAGVRSYVGGELSPLHPSLPLLPHDLSLTHTQRHSDDDATFLCTAINATWSDF